MVGADSNEKTSFQPYGKANHQITLSPTEFWMNDLERSPLYQ
jgi:hypothetical protein